MVHASSVYKGPVWVPTNHCGHVIICSYKDDEFVINDNQTVDMLRLQIERKLESGRYAKNARNVNLSVISGDNIRMYM